MIKFSSSFKLNEIHGLDSPFNEDSKNDSDNAYDITNVFGCFEKFLTYTTFLPSFIVVRH